MSIGNVYLYISVIYNCSTNEPAFIMTRTAFAVIIGIIDNMLKYYKVTKY